jgi:hypothetical protein
MKVHNSSAPTKTELRDLVKRAIGAAACRVLETHCGPGVMREGSWHDVASIYGIDTDPYSVSECIGDAAQFLRREDLHQWNVFDIDPFGDYAEFLWLVGQRRRIDEPVVILCTDGTAGGHSMKDLTMRKHGASRQVLDALGLRPNDKPSSVIGIRGAEWQFGQLVKSFFPTASIVRRWHAVNPSRSMHYHAAIIAPADSVGPELIKPAGRG